MDTQILTKRDFLRASGSVPLTKLVLRCVSQGTASERIALWARSVPFVTPQAVSNALLKAGIRTRSKRSDSR